MSDTARRDLLKTIAAATLAGSIPGDAAQHVHHEVAETKKASGVYKPKAFTDAEFKTIQVLAELITPGASQGNAAEFIDLLSSNSDRMKAAWTGGLAWIDRRTERDHKAPFAAAKPEQQTAVLDVIAFRKNADKDGNAPGVRFFDLARRMVVDAYYTSAAGIKEIGYVGNKGMSTFQVPKEAIEHAVNRSPFKAV